MARNIRELDISETYQNVLIINASSLVGAPANLDGPGRVSAARVQDGLGGETPLLVSRAEIGIDAEPKSYISAVRFIDLMESFAQSQNNSLIF